MGWDAVEFGTSTQPSEESTASISKAEVAYRKLDKIVMHPITTTFSDSQRKIQQDATMYQILLFHSYMKLNIFRAKHHPSSSA
jgi:hypothetical protein